MRELYAIYELGRVGLGEVIVVGGKLYAITTSKLEKSCILCQWRIELRLLLVIHHRMDKLPGSAAPSLPPMSSTITTLDEGQGERKAEPEALSISDASSSKTPLPPANAMGPPLNAASASIWTLFQLVSHQLRSSVSPDSLDGHEM